MLSEQASCETVGVRPSREGKGSDGGHRFGVEREMSCIMVGDPVEGVEVCAAPPVKRRDIAGVQFDFVTQNEVLAAVLQWRRSGHQRNVVLVESALGHDRPAQ